MNAKKKLLLAGKRLVAVISEAAREKMAEKIVIVDLGRASSTADYFIICQSPTTVQNRAIADAIVDACARKNSHPWHREGEAEGRWVLLDFSDVVVHIMLEELRAYYSLETLWSDAKVTAVPE